MTTCSRWIAVCVDMLEHPVVGMNVPPPKPADKSRHSIAPMIAWQDLIAGAAFAGRTVPHKGVEVVLDRGQFLAGRSYWAKRWNWGEQSVRSFFSRLVDRDMIAIFNQSDGHFANVATICNYDTYQSRRRDPRPEKEPEPNQSLTSGQPEGNQTLTKVTKVTKEDNNNTQHLDAARASAAPPPKVDLNELENRLREACNGALDNPVNCLGLANLSVPLGWLRDGADLEGEILPTLRAVGRKRHGARIRDWSYFTPILADARAKRSRELPAAADAGEAERAANRRKIFAISGGAAP